MDAGAALGTDRRAIFAQILPRLADQPSFSDKPSEFTCFEGSNFPVIDHRVPCYRKGKELNAKSLQPLHHLPDRMMKTVSARQANHEFSELLPGERGEEILITKQSKPGAVLSLYRPGLATPRQPHRSIFRNALIR
jgi:antitoxin (DNA-binding transcriptional repressor) of toxin-antitoxin stability system